MSSKQNPFQTNKSTNALQTSERLLQANEQ